MLGLISETQRKRYNSEGWWRSPTTIDDFREAAAQNPDKVAVVGYRVEVGDTDVLSYRQLSRLVDRFSGALLELGVRPGENVSFQLPNWWQFPTMVLACARIGAVANPIVPILRHRETKFILKKVESRLCVAPAVFRGFGHGEMLAEIAKVMPTLEHSFVIGADRPEGTEDFDEHFVRTRWEDCHGPEELDALAPGADDLAEIQFTSGTTGEAKGVMHTHNTLYAQMRAASETLGLGDDDAVYMASTLAHQTGYVYGLLMPLMLGMKVVYQDIWDADKMLELVSDEAVTWTMGATPFVIDTVAAYRRNPRDISSLRQFATAGAPIPPHLEKAMREELGTRLISIWGMTENGAVTYVRPDDPPEMAAESDGRPVPWMALRVVDEEGRELPLGTVGRLQIRGACQCLGYFKEEGLYREALDEEGWFDTGDLARMDETGAIRIAGRAKDLIIRGGENIPVLEVEAALYRHPKVKELAVVGYPDERLGERACAVVIPEDEPPSLEELKEHLEEEGVAKQFWPERMEVVSEMPTTASGKIQKYQLRQMLSEEQ